MNLGFVLIVILNSVKRLGRLSPHCVYIFQLSLVVLISMVMPWLCLWSTLIIMQFHRDLNIYGGGKKKVFLRLPIIVCSNPKVNSFGEKNQKCSMRFLFKRGFKMLWKLCPNFCQNSKHLGFYTFYLYRTYSVLQSSRRSVTAGETLVCIPGRVKGGVVRLSKTVMVFPPFIAAKFPFS